MASSSLRSHYQPDKAVVDNRMPSPESQTESKYIN